MLVHILSSVCNVFLATERKVSEMKGTVSGVAIQGGG